jgi:uncharacterized protein (TIGR03435 family)
MARAIWCGLMALAIAGSGFGQAPVPAARTAANLPLYEVSTIRLNNEGGWHQRWDETPDGVIYENLTIADLILAAYGTGHATDDQIIGVPGWAKEKRYNLTAKVSVDDADRLKGLKYRDRQTMLAAVLEERFHLKVHHEMRDRQHYALRVAKSGPKMKLATAQDTVKNEADGGATDEGTMHVSTLSRTTHSEWQAFTMERFAETMTWELWQLNRQIVDETGLKGRYDFTLDWSVDQGGDDGTASAPGIFTALQAQLGLKLEMLKGPLDCVIVDHVEEPTAN